MLDKVSWSGNRGFGATHERSILINKCKFTRFTPKRQAIIFTSFATFCINRVEFQVSQAICR